MAWIQKEVKKVCFYAVSVSVKQCNILWQFVLILSCNGPSLTKENGLFFNDLLFQDILARREDGKEL